MKKIISRFYLITIDNKPVYVGYTNRTVKQRFREHIKEKDLPEGTEVKQIDKLEFDFTWDIAQVNENAKLVSDRESRLIDKYNTKDSIYQKGLGNTQGGQTWANVKGFVYSNKDNPKYREMDSQELLQYLDGYRKRIGKLHYFVSNYKDNRLTKLHNFIINYQDIRLNRLHGFVLNYQDNRLNKLYNFINHYQDNRLNKLSGFINHYQDNRLNKLSGFITSYKDSRLNKLHNFIIRYKDPRFAKLHGFIASYKDSRLNKLYNFINHYQDPRLDKLMSFIGRYKN